MVFETSFLITVESANLKDIYDIIKAFYRKGFRISDFELEVETTIKTHKEGLSDD
jgi:hypothetical protein